MAKKEQDKDVAGFRSVGEAAHHVGKRMTQQTVKSKKVYTRKKKHKKDLPMLQIASCSTN